MLIYLSIVNVIAFILCFIDKQLAIKHKRRISEKTLLFFSSIGGCFMFYAGMYIFHHKTKHIKFKILVPLFILIWIYIILNRAF